MQQTGHLGAATSAPTRGPRFGRPASEPTHQSAGRRLLAALEAFERFPSFAGARLKALDAARGFGLRADVSRAVESDIALTVALLRHVNNGRGRADQVASVPKALEYVEDDELRALFEKSDSFDFFEPGESWGRAPQGHRLHALATQRAAIRVARATGYDRPDTLLVAALLHDVGKLVLCHADPRYEELPHPGELAPELRIDRERRLLGVDHALVGGVLARRWNLPHELARAIERHHQPHETGLAGLVRLSDMIARFEAGNPVDEGALQEAAATVGLSGADLRTLLSTAPSDDRPSLIPSPMTGAEHRVMRELATGHSYKEIATSLDLSVSTVRTHLYNTYKKLGVTDRAQAVLLAKEHGWV